MRQFDDRLFKISTLHISRLLFQIKTVIWLVLRVSCLVSFLLVQPSEGQKIFSPFGTEFLHQYSAILYDWTMENSISNRLIRMNLGWDAAPGGFLNSYVYFSEPTPLFHATIQLLDVPVSWSPFLLHRPTRPKFFSDFLKPVPWYGALLEAQGSNLSLGFYYAGQGNATLSMNSSVSQAQTSMLALRTGIQKGPVSAEVVFTHQTHRDVRGGASNQDLLAPDQFPAVYENFWFSNTGSQSGFWLERLVLTGDDVRDVIDGGTSQFPEGMVVSMTPQNILFQGGRYLWFPGDTRISFSNGGGGPRRWKTATFTFAGDLIILRNRSDYVEAWYDRYRPIPWSIARMPGGSNLSPSTVFESYGPTSFHRTVTFQLDHQANQGLGVNLTWQGRHLQARLSWALNEKNQAGKFDVRQGAELAVTTRLPWALASLFLHAHQDGFSFDLDGDPAVEIQNSPLKPFGFRVANSQDHLTASNEISPGYWWYYENPPYYFRALGQDLNHNGIQDDRETFLTPAHFPVPGDYGEGHLSFAGRLGKNYGWTALLDGRWQEGRFMSSLAFILDFQYRLEGRLSVSGAAMEEFWPHPNLLPAPSLAQVDLLTPGVLKNQVLALGEIRFDWLGFKLLGEANLAHRLFEAGSWRVEFTPALSLEHPIQVNKFLEVIPRARVLFHLQRSPWNSLSLLGESNAFGIDRALLGAWSESFLVFLLESRVRYANFNWFSGGEFVMYDQNGLGEVGVPGVYSLGAPMTRFALTSRLEFKGNYLWFPLGLSMTVQFGISTGNRVVALPPFSDWNRFSSIVFRLFTGF